MARLRRARRARISRLRGQIALTAERTLRVLGVRDDDADQLLVVVVEAMPGSATVGAVCS